LAGLFGALAGFFFPMATSVRLARLLLILLTLGLFGCDHATKIAAKASLEGAAAVPIAPGLLELRYVENDDIAFSAFHHLGLPRSPAVFALLSSLAIALLVGGLLLARWRSRRASGAVGNRPPVSEAPPDRMVQAAWAFILGGAFGNLADRILRGYVVDFIHLTGWPIFNVADIAVVIGFALMILSRSGLRRAQPS
jgi:signal peptidase II